MNQSRAYLEMIVALQPHAHAGAGTSHGYLLEHGQEWEAAPLPAEVEQGEPKMCYVNAYRLAAHNPGRFFYVEGYATAMIPTEHAWCVDRQGRVIDCTPHWEKGRDYFGVKFNISTLHAIQRITKGYGALAHWEHWGDVRKVLLGRPTRPRLQCGQIPAKRRKVK